MLENWGSGKKNGFVIKKKKNVYKIGLNWIPLLYKWLVWNYKNTNT